MPVARVTEVLRVAPLAHRLVEASLERHDRGSDEEVGEENDEEHCPDDSKPVTVPHNRHAILLTHHNNQLLSKRAEHRVVIADVRSHDYAGEIGKAKLDGNKHDHVQ